MILTKHGYQIHLEDQSEIKKILTVRPDENALGFQGAPFKLYRSTNKGSLLVPRYFGTNHFGPPSKDTRGPPAPARIQFTGTLRAETRQLEAFEKGKEAFRTVGGGVLSLAPGFGKTVLALAFSAHLKTRTLIVVHKEFLANQWKERIEHFCPGATIGRIQQDTFDTDKDFVIAMIQTLCSRENGPEDFNSFGFLIVDEAHHIGASAFSQTMFKFCPKWSLGLTATPERKDGLTRVLYWFLGPEFFRVNRENQKQTKIETVWFDHPRFREAPPLTRFGKINMAQMVTDVTEIQARNTVILGLIEGALSQGRKILVLTDRREHCEFLFSKFDNQISGIYYGGLSETELGAASQKRIIFATFSMAQEGLDIPTLDTLVLATPHSDVTQAIGRIMRETPGKKNNPLIFDVADRWSVFQAMYRKRCVIYKSVTGLHPGEEEKVEILEPKKCNFI